jgi:hypothetical protein
MEMDLGWILPRCFMLLTVLYSASSVLRVSLGLPVSKLLSCLFDLGSLLRFLPPWGY